MKFILLNLFFVLIFGCYFNNDHNGVLMEPIRNEYIGYLSYFDYNGCFYASTNMFLYYYFKSLSINVNSVLLEFNPNNQTNNLVNGSLQYL